jgi:hypothetical protein
MFVAFILLYILFLTDVYSNILFYFVNRNRVKVKFDLNSIWLALYINI